MILTRSRSASAAIKRGTTTWEIASSAVARATVTDWPKRSPGSCPRDARATSSNKNQTSDVLNKVGGSVGFGAAARSVLFFAPDPEDPDPESYKRILAHAKCNVGPLAPALRFRVQGR